MTVRIRYRRTVGSIWLLCVLLGGMARLQAAALDVYVAGDIADCTTKDAAKSGASKTAALIPPGSLVLVPGDAVYGPPTLENYRTCYQPTWGQHLGQTLAVPGNHDYRNGGTEDFARYFGAATTPAGYLAKRMGGWLLVGLDSNLEGEAYQRQLGWLRQTLETHGDARCVLAFWHHPLYSSGPHRGSGAHMQSVWSLLDEHEADLVLNGHEHNYERFPPLDADARPLVQGMREFVVGTGGAMLYGFWRPPYASEMRIKRHGVLHLKLAEDRYSWEFIRDDRRIRDRGSAVCRR